MLNKILKITLIVLAIFAVSNLGFLDYQWLSQKNNKSVSTNEATANKPLTTNSEYQPPVDVKQRGPGICGTECLDIISETVKSEVSKISIPTSIPQKSTSSSSSKVVFVPLATTGAVSSMSWTDVVPSDFYFNLSDYPGAKEVRFVTYLLSINNDLGFAKLFDNTNKKEVYFSSVQTNSSTFVLVESQPIQISPGNNKYTIQLRSVNATQVQIKDAKLKIVF